MRDTPEAGGLPQFLQILLSYVGSFQLVI